MTMHLNENEVFDYLKGGRTSLPDDRKSHLDGCEFCRQKLKEQAEVGSILAKMKSLKAPAGIYEYVSHKINNKPAHKKDWFFYITLGTLAIVALLLFFDSGSSKMQTKSNRPEQVKEFIQDKMAIDKINIEENTEQLYQKINGFFKAIGRSTYGSTIIFVFCVVLFYFFLDQQFLRKKLNH